MAKIQCKMCGGELDLPEGFLAGQCPYCWTLTTFPKLSSDELANLYNRAEHFRRINEYDKAVAAYEKIVEVNPDDAEAYWGIVISKFGIEYVEDPVSRERIPTCHRAHYESILADADYLNALEKAGSSEKALYEAEARRIAICQQKTFQLAQRFADEKLQEIFTLSENERKAKIIQGEKRRKRRKILYITSAILGIIIIAVSLFFAFPYMRGYKLSWDGTELVEVTDKDITEFTIPDGVTSIGDSAFDDCSNLKSVTIPASVTVIENRAFSGCGKLTSVTADPKWLSKLPEKQLTSFTVADGVTGIDDSAFEDCYRLKSVTIPDSVTTIGNNTFSGCLSLTSVTIPNSVTSIGESVFENCSSLKSVTIPDSVTNIGDYAFYNCSSLKSVTIPRYCEVGYDAFPDGCKVIRR